MELLETQDPEKKRLIEVADRHKKEIQQEVKAMSDKTEQVVKNALIIGGTLAVSYLLVSQLGSGKKKRNKTKTKANIQNSEPDHEPVHTYSPPTLFSQIGDRLVSQATVILLDLAKDKLAEYLSNRKQKHEDS